MFQLVVVDYEQIIQFGSVVKMANSHTISGHLELFMLQALHIGGEKLTTAFGLFRFNKSQLFGVSSLCYKEHAMIIEYAMMKLCISSSYRA